MIGILKKQMWRSFEGKKYKHDETCTILKEAAQVVNSCRWSQAHGQKATPYVLKT
jgi:hypothetical protein